MLNHARPACPYCGERQAYDEARPSKPIVYNGAWDMQRRRYKRETTWHTECRACGARIIWSVPFGTLHIGRTVTMSKSHAGPSWVKP